MVVRCMLSNDNVTSVHETTSRFDVHYRSALCRVDAGHGGRVHALTVGFAENVLGTGPESVQTDNVHLRCRRTHMFFFYAEPGEL